MLEGGTIFGELALTSRGTREAYAQCMEDSEIGILRLADVERLVLEKPQVGLSLARLASLIVLLIESEGLRIRKGYKVPTRYTHQHLGAMIGANREAVTRAFTQLREAGTVETENRLIHVRDIEALERAAEQGLPARV